MSADQVITKEPGRSGQILYESPQGVKVRTMTIDDCQFAGRMTVEGFHGKFLHIIGEHNLPLAEESLAGDHRLSPFLHHRHLIAELDGKRVGFMALKFHGDRKLTFSSHWRRMSHCPWFRISTLMRLQETIERGRCCLDMLVVDANCRGKGVGKILMDVAEQQARAENCPIIYLWVAFGNRAKNLYEREGYSQVGTETFCGLLSCMAGVRGFDVMEKPLGS